MGRGDKKTRKGKITMGSYGVLRPRKKATPIIIKAAVKPVKVKAEKKVKVEISEKPVAKKIAKKKAE